MKRIDRYVACGFLLRFVIAHLVIFGLFVSFDALQRIDHLQKGAIEETLPRLLIYYALQFPTHILDTVPPLLLLAAGLMLVRMSRDGELLTLKASGISVHRVILPIFLCTVPVVTLVLWTRENVVPWSFREQELLDQEMDERVSGPFLLKDADQKAVIFVGRYDYSTHTMSRVCVMEFTSDGALNRTIEADSGGWLQEGGMYLETVSIEEFGKKAGSAKKPKVLLTKRIETSLTPYDFVRAKRNVMSTRLPALTTSELRQRIQHNPDSPYFRVMFHSRLAAPLGCFALLLIGIPLLIGFQHSTQSRALAAVVCVLVAGVVHVLSFVSLSMGITGLIDPVLAAWLPPGLAGALGLYLFGTMHT